MRRKNSAVARTERALNAERCCARPTAVRKEDTEQGWDTFAEPERTNKTFTLSDGERNSAT